MTSYLVLKWTGDIWTVPSDRDNVAAGPFVTKEFAELEIASFGDADEHHLYTTVSFIIPEPLS